MSAEQCPEPVGEPEDIIGQGEDGTIQCRRHETGSHYAVDDAPWRRLKSLCKGTKNFLQC